MQLIKNGSFVQDEWTTRADDDALPVTGRAYSYARMLRDRFGFKGEVRAVGGVLRDQFFYMSRVGFDALEVGDNITPEAYADAISTFKDAYQPSADGRERVLSLRQRLAAKAGQSA